MAVAKVWNGSAWVPAKWKTHNGTGWVEQSKVWNGSAWDKIGGSLPVVFDAVGPGGSGSGNFLQPTINFEWTHTASGDGRAVVVGVVAVNTTSISVTYGGQPMAALTPGGEAGRPTQQFVLLNPPSGAQVARVTASRRANSGYSAAGNSVSYNNVASFVQADSSNGIGTTLSLTVLGAKPGDTVAQAFGYDTATPATDYNKTLRSSTAGPQATVLLGDSDEGVSGISFTATTGLVTVEWSGVSVILHPA